MSTSVLLDGREGRDAVGVVGEGVDLRWRLTEGDEDEDVGLMP